MEQGTTIYLGYLPLILQYWLGARHSLIQNPQSPSTAYSLVPEPIAMAFAELCTAMDDPFETFRPPTALPLDTHDPEKPCYFFTLPPELRDIVYGCAISSGDVQLLRVSKEVYREGIEHLYKHRTCLLKIDIMKYVPMFSLQKPVAALIQNLDIEMIIPHSVPVGRWLHNFKPIRKFSGATVKRQTCRVTFILPPDKKIFDVEHVQGAAEIMLYLQTLIGFSRLIFKARSQSPHRERSWKVWQLLILEPSYQDTIDSLGTGSWYTSDDPQLGYHEFRPRAHMEANPGTLPLAVQRRIERWEKDPRRALRRTEYRY